MLRGRWDLPGPGLEPVSPALTGRFLTTAPPGKSQRYVLFKNWGMGVYGHVGEKEFIIIIFTTEFLEIHLEAFLNSSKILIDTMYNRQ